MRYILLFTVWTLLFCPIVPSFGQSVSPLLKATSIDASMPGTTFENIVNDIQSHISPTDTGEGGVADQLDFFRTYWEARVSATDSSGTDMFTQYTNRLRYAVAARMAGTATCGGGWQGDWQVFGPDSMPTYHGIGKINAVWADPNDSTFILAGSSGGLFKSTDGGTNWQCISDNALLVGGRMGVSSIAVNPLKRDNIYISTGVIEENGTNIAASFLKTNDGGNSWQQVIIPTGGGYADTNAFVQKVIITPDSSRLYVFRTGDIYTIATAGGSWIKITPPGSFTMFKEFQFVPGNQNHFFVSDLLGQAGIYESNVGVPSPSDWIKITTSLPQEIIGTDTLNYSSYVGFSISVPNSDTLYAVGMSYANYAHQLLFKYDIASSHSWSVWATSIPDEFQSWVNKSNLIVSPNNTQVIYYGGSRPSVSLDYGATFTSMSLYDGTMNNHADIRDMFLQRSTNTVNGIGDRLYLANDGGVSMKPPGNVVTALGYNTLVSKNGHGLVCGEINGLAMSYDGRLMVEGMQHDGVSSYERLKDTAWIYLVNLTDAGSAGFDRTTNHGVVFHGGYPEKIVPSGSRQLGIISGNGITPTPNIDGQIGLSEPFFIDNSGNQYVGWHFLWKFNAGSVSPTMWSFKDVFYGLSNTDTTAIKDFTFSPDDTDLTGYILYNANKTGTAQHLEYRNPPSITSFFDLFPFGSLPNNLMNCVTMDVAQPDHVWIGMGGSGTDVLQVQYSPNAGSNWYSVSYGLPSHMPVVKMIHQNASNVVFAATDVGIYRCDFSMFDPSLPNNGIQWTCFNNDAITGTGFPNVSVTDMKINYCQGKLYVATYGRGIWSSDLNAPGTTVIVNPTNTISTNTIWSNSQQYITGSIDVLPGVTFTIDSNDTVHMPKGGVITVEAGAHLIVDHATLTNSCENCLWGGIRVLGDPSLSQTTTNQGWATIQDGAVIENAEVGAATGYQGAYWVTSGGIIQAFNSYFLNNHYGVSVSEYHSYNAAHVLLPLLTHFDNCVFKTDLNYKGHNMNYPLKAHALLQAVDGVTFKGCQFLNTDTFAVNKGKGVGILANGASFNVSPYCPSLVSCPSPWRSRFCGLQHGITAQALPYWIPTSSTIYEADFDSVSVGVYVSAMNNVNTTYCNFTVGNGLSEIDATSLAFSGCFQNVGIYTQNTNQFRIENNTFTGASSLYSEWYNIGTAVVNSGATNNRVYLNNFAHLTEGVYAIGNNKQATAGITAASGLTIACNDFNTNNIDILIAPDGGSTLQGINHMQLPGGATAGNTFFNSLNNIINTGGGIYYYYDAAVSAQHPTHTVSANVILSPVSLHAVCTSGTRLPGSIPRARLVVRNDTIVQNYKTSLALDRTTLGRKQDSLAAIIDYGNSDSLSALLLGAGDSTKVSLLLKAASPNLSARQIMLTEQNNLMNGASIMGILQRNIDIAADPDFLDSLVTAGYITSTNKTTLTGLYTNSSNNSRRTRLEGAIASYTSKIADENNMFITAIKTDADTSVPVDDTTGMGIVTDSASVYYMLDSNSAYNLQNEIKQGLKKTPEMWAVYALAGYNLYLQNNTLTSNNMTQADSLISIYGGDTTELADYHFLYDAMVKIGAAGQDVFNMTDAEIGLLDTFSTPSLPVTAARLLVKNITTVVNTKNSIVAVPCEPAYGYRSENTTTTGATSPFTDANNAMERATFTVYPNPASNMVRFTYNTADGCEGVDITISNVVGKTVAVLHGDNASGSVSWSTGSLPSGVYLYKATCDNGVIKTGKLVIEK